MSEETGSYRDEVQRGFPNTRMTKSRGILPPRKAWTSEALRTLTESYANQRAEDIAAALGRSIAAIHGKAKSLGLKKSAAFLTGPQSGRLSPNTCQRGINYRFQKGEVQGNRNIAVFGVRTRFKKGSRPHNWAPVGSERMSADGIRQRKITDTGYSPRDWQSVHSLIWVEANGPVPDGHIVVFRDRDHTNIVLENLELVSLEDNMERNTIHRYPSELRDVIRLSAKLKRAIGNLEDEQQTR